MDPDRKKEMYEIPGTGKESYARSFINADLVVGVLTVNHHLNQKWPVVVVYNSDNPPVQILPDFIYVADENRVTVDLSSYGVIVGVWYVRVIGG
jgi:hypothetical protein